MSFGSYEFRIRKYVIGLNFQALESCPSLRSLAAILFPGGDPLTLALFARLAVSNRCKSATRSPRCLR
jgi:hypothetical protein